MIDLIILNIIQYDPINRIRHPHPFPQPPNRQHTHLNKRLPTLLIRIAFAYERKTHHKRIHGYAFIGGLV
jgi:hypothetical protein